MYGVRFSFVATRSGLTRVRHYDVEDMTIKKEALAFLRKHARAMDETYYSRTVDFNLLVNDNATLIQVPFNTHQKIRDRLKRYELNQILDGADGVSMDTSSSASLDGSNSNSDPTLVDGAPTRPTSVKDMDLISRLNILRNSSLHVIASQSIIANEGAQRAVAGVSGIFYDYATFVLRFFESTNSQFQEGTSRTKPASCYTETASEKSCEDLKAVRCGLSNDTIDCLLVDNNGYIVVSEDLDYIGQHLRVYDHAILQRLVSNGVFHAINITDHQSVCIKQEEKQPASSALSLVALQSLLFRPSKLATAVLSNFISALASSWTILATVLSNSGPTSAQPVPLSKQQQVTQSMLSLLPNKTYLRPCEKTLTLYESRPGRFRSESVERYTTHCGCQAWFVYEQVPQTNLFILIVEAMTVCRQGCDFEPVPARVNTEMSEEIVNSEDHVCSVLERESSLYRKKLDSCFSHHPDEEHIKLCGAGSRTAHLSNPLITLTVFISFLFALVK